MGTPSGGFLQVWNAGYNAAVYHTRKWGKFPPPYSEETVAGQVTMLVWFFLLYFDRFTEEPKSFAGALEGDAWITLREERELIRRVRRRLEQDVGRDGEWKKPDSERCGRAEDLISQF